jgi:exonuclease SbcD
MKVLHLADIHLGMENYGKIDPVTGLNTRLQDFIRCFSFAIDTAIKEEVDLVVFAGDAYKNSNPSATHQREFAKQIYRLSAAKIPTVMVKGNHDNPVSYGRATSIDIFSTLEIPNVYVVNSPDILRIPTKSGEANIFAVPWPTKEQHLNKEEMKGKTEKEITQLIQEKVVNLIKYFASYGSNDSIFVPNIFVGHLAIAEATFSGSETSVIIGTDPVIPARLLANSNFDYVALGHIHKYQNLNPEPEGKPPIVYSGSIERLNFGEEKDPKGFCLVNIEKGETSYKFIPVPAREFITIDVEIKEEEDPTETLLAEIAKHNLDNSVMRIYYTIPEDRKQLIDFARINEALKDSFMVKTISEKTKPVIRATRMVITEDLGMLEALDRYIDNNEDLKPYADEMISKAKELDQELTNSERSR